MPSFTAFLAAFLTRFTTVPVKAVIALSIPSGDADWLKLAHLIPAPYLYGVLESIGGAVVIGSEVPLLCGGFPRRTERVYLAVSMFDRAW
jgi:hypothetical protein